MIDVKSYGIIPLKKLKGEWQVLLIQHIEGHWGFPKGRPEQGESCLETAYRELNEETALFVDRLLSTEPLIEQYNFKKDGLRYNKSVYYYLAIVVGNVSLLEEEVRASEWVCLSRLQEKLSFCDIKKMAANIDSTINKITI